MYRSSCIRMITAVSDLEASSPCKRRRSPAWPGLLSHLPLAPYLTFAFLPRHFSAIIERCLLLSRFCMLGSNRCDLKHLGVEMNGGGVNDVRSESAKLYVQRVMPLYAKWIIIQLTTNLSKAMAANRVPASQLPDSPRLRAGNNRW